MKLYRDGLTTRQRRHRDGLCVDCGERAPQEGHQRCTGCSRFLADKRAALRPETHFLRSHRPDNAEQVTLQLLRCKDDAARRILTGKTKKVNSEFA